MICNQLSTCIAQEHAGNINHLCVNRNRNDCIESADRRSKVKCEEKNKKYIFDNTLNNFVVSYKIDGGVVVEDSSVENGTNKCDYLYMICEEEQKAVLIELKGVDVAKALKQIKATLLLFQDVFEECENVYGRLVVMSAMPDLKARPEYVTLAKILRGKYHGNLKIVERQFVEKDINLDEV